MSVYSEEYKQELKEEYESLLALRQQVLECAGDGPYNAEERLIMSDYEDVCAEYNEVFGCKPPMKNKVFEKIRDKVSDKIQNRELPAYKREPVYCDNYSSELRALELSEYVQLRKSIEKSSNGGD